MEQFKMAHCYRWLDWMRFRKINDQTPHTLELHAIERLRCTFKMESKPRLIGIQACIWPFQMHVNGLKRLIEYRKQSKIKTYTNTHFFTLNLYSSKCIWNRAKNEFDQVNYNGFISDHRKWGTKWKPLIRTR